MNPPVRFDPAISPNLVIVSVRALGTAFFQGIDQFLVDIFRDKKRALLANQRAPELFLELSMPQDAQ
jgi:hypothetical protein